MGLAHPCTRVTYKMEPNQAVSSEAKLEPKGGMQTVGVLFHNAVWGCSVGTGRSTNTDVNWSVICFWMRVVSSIVGHLINHSIHYEVATEASTHNLVEHSSQKCLSHQVSLKFCLLFPGPSLFFN
jgi:hypothetical protein